MSLARRQQQHGHLPAGAPPFLDHADAVHLRQADIEDHRIIGLRIAEEMPLLAVEGAIHDIARVRERVRNLTIEIPFVLDDEYSHVMPYLL